MDIRQFFFKYRGFTPIPLILIVIIFARPSWVSFLVGGILMILGEIVRIWGVAFAGGATRTRNVGAGVLVTNGPFAYLRNPLYLGNMTMYTGAAVIANVWVPWLILIVWIFFGLQYYLIVLLEEEKLEKIFGSQYIQYISSVPRFIPRLSAYEKKSDIKPDLHMAIRSEKSTFLSFAAVTLLLLTKMVFF
jgi:protein-S-isoprenylcysteine O-methyltransferase Ste14